MNTASKAAITAMGSIIISFLREAHGAAVAFPQTALRAVAGESLD